MVRRLAGSDFEKGEGWVGNRISGGTNRDYNNILTPYVYASGPDAEFYYAIAGRSQYSHPFTVKIGSSVIINSSFIGYDALKTSTMINPGILAANNTINFAAGTTSQGQSISLSYFEIEYPRQFNFDGKSTFYFKIDGDPVNKKYFEITNFNNKSTTPVL